MFTLASPILRATAAGLNRTFRFAANHSVRPLTSALLVLVLTAVPALFAASGRSQAPTTTPNRMPATATGDAHLNPLDHPIPKTWQTIGPAPPIAQASSILFFSQVPGGIVQTRGCGPEPINQGYSALNQTVGQALVGIFGPHGYVVVANHGVANVLPSGSALPALLLTRIERFDYQDGNVIAPPSRQDRGARAENPRPGGLTASAAVLGLPQIAATAKRLGLQALPLQGLRAGVTDVHYTFHLRDFTLFQVLNAVVAKSQGGVAQWKYVQQICGATRTYLLDISNM